MRFQIASVTPGAGFFASYAETVDEAIAQFLRQTAEWGNADIRDSLVHWVPDED